MAIDLDSGTGLFDAIGALGGGLNALNAFRGDADLSGASITSVGVFVANIFTKVAAADRDVFEGLYGARDAHRGVYTAFAQTLAAAAAGILVELVNADVLLNSPDVASAMAELVRQMKAASESVQKPTVSATPAAGSSNVGGAVVVASVLDKDGAQLDSVFAETIDLACTRDALDGATEGQEEWSVRGDAAADSALDWDYEKGSGASATLTAVDAAEGQGANLLNNSSFEDFTTADTPDNWTILLGTASTTIFDAGAGNGYAGAASPKALKITGNGSELTSIAQTFGATSGGTTSGLTRSTVYAVNVWLKKTTSLAAGVLDIELVDGTNTVINDDAGTANRLRVTLSGLTTSFVAHSAFFRTPNNLPATVKLRVRLSTAATNSESVLIDHLALTPATQLYAGGVYAAVFSGAVASVSNLDTYTVAVANDYGGAIVRVCEQFFGMRELGLKLPSSGSPTVDDALVA